MKKLDLIFLMIFSLFIGKSELDHFDTHSVSFAQKHREFCLAPHTSIQDIIEENYPELIVQQDVSNEFFYLFSKIIAQFKPELFVDNVLELPKEVFIGIPLKKVSGGYSQEFYNSVQGINPNRNITNLKFGNFFVTLSGVNQESKVNSKDKGKVIEWIKEDPFEKNMEKYPYLKQFPGFIQRNPNFISGVKSLDNDNTALRYIPFRKTPEEKILSSIEDEIKNRVAIINSPSSDHSNAENGLNKIIEAFPPESENIPPAIKTTIAEAFSYSDHEKYSMYSFDSLKNVAQNNPDYQSQAYYPKMKEAASHLINNKGDFGNHFWSGRLLRYNVVNSKSEHLKSNYAQDVKLMGEIIGLNSNKIPDEKTCNQLVDKQLHYIQQYKENHKENTNEVQISFKGNDTFNQIINFFNFTEDDLNKQCAVNAYSLVYSDREKLPPQVFIEKSNDPSNKEETTVITIKTEPKELKQEKYKRYENTSPLNTLIPDLPQKPDNILKKVYDSIVELAPNVDNDSDKKAIEKSLNGYEKYPDYGLVYYKKLDKITRNRELRENLHGEDPFKKQQAGDILIAILKTLSDKSPESESNSIMENTIELYEGLINTDEKFEKIASNPREKIKTYKNKYKKLDQISDRIVKEMSEQYLRYETKDGEKLIDNIAANHYSKKYGDNLDEGYKQYVQFADNVIDFDNYNRSENEKHKNLERYLLHHQLKKYAEINEKDTSNFEYNPFSPFNLGFAASISA